MTRPIVLLSVAVLLAGCGSGGPAGPPSGTVPDITVTQGDTEAVTIDVTEVTGVRLRLPNVSGVSLDVGNATVEPPPDSVAESYPPIWQWDSTQPSATVTVTIQVAPDAPTGRVAYGVELFGTKSATATATGHITVQQADTSDGTQSS